MYSNIYHNKANIESLMYIDFPIWLSFKQISWRKCKLVNCTYLFFVFLRLAAVDSVISTKVAACLHLLCPGQRTPRFPLRWGAWSAPVFLRLFLLVQTGWQAFFEKTRLLLLCLFSGSYLKEMGLGERNHNFSGLIAGEMKCRSWIIIDCETDTALHQLPGHWCMNEV